MGDVIFTPKFRGTVYLCHVCSECGYELKVAQSFWGGPYFESTDGIKYCPSCGKPVVRFSEKATFVVAIDFDPLRAFHEARTEYEEKCEWLYHCKMSAEEQRHVLELISFADDYDVKWIVEASKAVRKAAASRLSWQGRAKLEKKFGGGNNAQTSDPQ
jgi:hypothetical protein